MSKEAYKIPKFKTDAEAAAFWDIHDSTRYLSQTKSASLKFPKPRHKVTINLGEKEWEILQRLAHRKRLSFNHLLERILLEQLTASQ